MCLLVASFNDIMVDTIADSAVGEEAVEGDGAMRMSVPTPKARATSSRFPSPTIAARSITPPT